MTSYRVLVVANLWPYEADPSYGCFVKAQMESLRPLGVDYDVLFINGRESRWNYLRALPQLWQRLRSHRYDLIHAHMGLSGLEKGRKDRLQGQRTAVFGIEQGRPQTHHGCRFQTEFHPDIF